jgi:PKD repeat protein
MVSGLMAQQVMHIDQVHPRHQAQIDLNDHNVLKQYQPETHSQINAQERSGAVSVIQIGSAYNIYTTLLDEQNQVAYNPDLNSIVFVHRHNDGTPGGSGGLAFDVSTDGGATWTDNYALSPGFNDGTVTTSSGNRYPSITIYNPAGNTDPANAYVAAVGPSLTPITGGSWGLNFQHSAGMTDGSDVSEEYVDTDGTTTDFHPYGATAQPDGTLWSISTKFIDGSSPGDYSNFYVNQGNWNGGTTKVDWTSPYLDIVPNYYFTSDGLPATGYGWNIAFSPDGMTGYAAYLASEVSAVYEGIQPNVWKTTDGGANWSRLPDYDFRNLTAYQDFLIPTGSGQTIPFPTSIDMVVDANGTLHMHNLVLPRSSSDADSIYFIWTGVGTEGLFHMSTSDGTDWTAALIDTVNTEAGAVGGVGHGPRTQISRSEDGTKIFFSWVDSDPLIGFNDLPNTFIRGYDVNTGEWTFIKNVTGGTAVDGITYFSTLAEVSITGGSEQDHEMPIVFAEPGPTDLDPPQFWFLRGAGFDDADFGALAPQATADFSFVVSDNTVDFTNASSNADTYVWDFGDASSLSGLTNPSHTYAAVGTYTVCLTAKNAGTPDTDDESCQDVDITSVVSGINDPVLEAALDLFPSPTSGVLNIRLDAQFTGATVEIYNMIGELVVQPTLLLDVNTSFDLSNLANGQYLVKVQGENGAATRSVTLTR